MTIEKGSRNLLILALVLLIAGFASSTFWSASHEAPFLATLEDYGGAIVAAAGNDAGAASSLTELQWNKTGRAARLVEAHGHLLFLCIFLILFAMLLAGQPRPGPGSLHIDWLAVSGVLMYPAGLAAQASDYLIAGQVLSATGALLILTFAGTVVVRLYHRPRIVAQSPGVGQST